MADEVGWLVEWPGDQHQPVRWWHPDHGWTIDASAALRFSRQKDADDYIAGSNMKWAKATEHSWRRLRSMTEPDMSREGTIMGRFDHRHFWRPKTALNTIVTDDKKTIGGLIVEDCTCGAVRTIEFAPGVAPVVRTALGQRAEDGK